MRGNSRIPRLLLAVIIAVTAGCASEFEQRLAEAEALRAEAAVAGAEWLETGELLEQARAEAAQGNTEYALELVARARFQAERAIQQSEREAQAWTERVIR